MSRFSNCKKNRKKERTLYRVYRLSLKPTERYRDIEAQSFSRFLQKIYRGRSDKS